MDISLVRHQAKVFAFVLFTALILLVVLLTSIARGAVGTLTTSDLTSTGQTIKASSAATAVIGINVVVSASETMASTSLMIAGTGGFVAADDLAALGTATSSGIAIYRDDAVSGTNGSFDSTDDVIPLASAPTFSGATTTLTFAGVEALPANNTGDNEGSDYFIVVQTSAAATNARLFTVSLYPGEVGFNVVRQSTPTALTTKSVTIDTVAPTVNTNTTGPASGSTNVPVSTFIHMGFSENLDQSTLNSNNIIFTQNGSAVGAGIRPFPDGFDIVVSNPPTYTASTKFAKVTTVSTGFYNVSGTNAITPQGAYTAPLYGDIVYTQFGTFPPEVGVITNSVLTSGTFAINGNALFSPSQVTKFASPAFATTTGTGSPVGIGDLVVTNTSANPADVRYGWHIVTTGASINGSGLRLDGASGQPTYPASTTLSKILPAATSTMDASGRLNATTTFSAGDLVFARVDRNGDHNDTYSWHLVTTGETINGLLGSGATPGTTSALRLDSGNGAPHFAPSSAFAKITTSATGAIDSGAQNATVFSLGDMLFARTTAGASNLDAYNFHLVSGGATGATSTALRLDNASSNLATSTTYVVTAKPGVTDSAGNALAASSTLSFTTGGTGGTNISPPYVQSSQPQGGSQSHPINGPIKLTFSVAMKSDGGANAVTNTAVVKLSTDVNGQPGVAVTSTNTYDSTTNTVTVTPSANLTASTNYVVLVMTTAQSTNNIGLPNEYRLYFRTSSGADSTAPTVLGVNPTNNSTNISLGPVFTAGFSEDMDPSTVTNSTLKLATQIGGTAVSGNVTYNQQSRSASFAPSTALSASTGYKFTVGAGLTGPADLSGNRLAATSTTFATTTATADTSAPSVQFASADNFGIAITFSETMKTGGGPNAADNVANYTLESPLGTSIGLGGKTVTYDGMTKTARISGLSLSNGSQFKATVATPVQDLAGNGISTSGTPAGNIAVGTVQNSSQTGGQLGPGTGTIDQSVQGMNPTQLMPMVRMAGAISDYRVNFLAGTSIPSGGQIIVTFPSGFDVSRASTTPAASSLCNNDINGTQFSGPASLPVIASASANSDAGTVTITTAGDATGANTFICLELTGIINSTVPSSSGYTGDIKTRDTAANNRAILETKTTSPFFLGAAGTRTLTVNVFNDGNANSTNNANEGIAAVKVFLFSPATGGNSTTTNASGVASFTSLADGDYMVGIDPGTLASASSTVVYNSSPQPITISATNLTKNIIVSGGGSTIALSGTVTGPNGTDVDIFASSGQGFTKVVKTMTGSAVSYSLRISPSTIYSVGVGPGMPDSFFIPGGPPPKPPTFTFMPPPNVTVIATTTNVTGVNFTLSSADKTITGTVVDSAGSAVSNAGVFARPISNTTSGGGPTSDLGFGSGGQTDTSGAFSINVVAGTYLVGVFKPGMPSVPDQQITVPSSGANTPSSLAFKLGTASTLTISGTVKDDNGNAIPYAGVGGRKVVSTADTTPIGGGQGNFVGGPTDANGAYTLYVTNGVWQIEAYAPGFGKLGSKTVTVSGSSLSGQDFSAQTLSLGTVTGTTTKAAVAVQGVMVHAEGANGRNFGVSDADGVYSLKLPAGSYTLTCFFPGIGDSTPIDVTSTADTTSYSNNCALAAPITVTVNLTDGTNPITNAYVDARTSTGRGNGTSESTSSGANATYTLTLSPGTYTVRAGHPAFGPIGSTGSVSSTQTITYTAPTLYSVTGTVNSSGVGTNNAFVSLTGRPTGQTNTIMVGAQTNDSGAYTISAPKGSYQLRADKPGYILSEPVSVTVAGNTTATEVSLRAASRTISGTVSLSSSGVSGAFVDATDGSGGFAVAQTDSAGAYSLSVTPASWVVTARSIGYHASTTVDVTSASASGQNITLAAISGFTLTAERQETITPTAGGFVTNSDIGSNFKLTIPANALGTGSNAGTVKTQANTAVPGIANGTVLSKNAVTISAVDSSGQPVKSLNDAVTVVVPYTEASVPSGTSEADLQLGVWNDATQAYDMLPTTVDVTNNTLTANVSHFSDFAPISPAQSSGSAASTGSTGSSGSSGGGGGGGGGSGGSIVNPPAKTIAKAQIIYPDGTVTYVDQNLGVATGAAAAGAARGSAAGGARFSVLLRQGSKHADVARLQKALGVDPTGYFGPLTRAAVEAFQVKHVIAKRGDPGFGTLGPKTRAKLNELFGEGTGVAAPQASAQGQAQSGQAAVTSGTLTRAVKVGSSGDDVKLLQVVLNTDADTRIALSGAGSPGNETTLFGRLTLVAIQRFQVKHGIVKPGGEGYGNVGPKTRAKLNEILAAWLAATTPAPAPTPEPTPAPTPSPVATSTDATATTTASVSADATATTTSSTTSTTTVTVSVSATTTSY
ncbi:Ig-like domain-containing protein [Candidatus Kaiserbacteria bacterium]|nr:Ig-like domain-containing protein [Candidatus Kaiserbacteria bacterium]